MFKPDEYLAKETLEKKKCHYTLGIGDVFHDVSVCLMKDTQVIEVIEEERITRVKHGVIFPEENYNLDKHKESIDAFIKNHPVELRYKKLMSLIKHMLNDNQMTMADIDTVVVSTLFEEYPFKNEALLIDHHMAHAASTFYTSPFEEAAILVLDGNGNANEKGELNTALMGIGNEKLIQPINYVVGIKEKNDSLIALSNSLGLFYKNITILMGLGDFAEGTTMALAAYGKRNACFDFIKNYVHLEDDGLFSIKNKEIFQECTMLISQAKETMNKDELFQLYADLAFTHQKILESIVIHCCNYLSEKTNLKSICLSGGVALNCVANTKIIKETSFENIFIQPAAGDNGISIGCATYGAYSISRLQRSNNIFSPYLGKKNDNKFKSGRLESYSQWIEPVEITGLYKQVAKLISQGNIVGWFQGRSEIGPRALGNRSILADPRNIKSKIKLNMEIKKRESFRPFAPAVLSEYVEDYFQTKEASPYMTLIAKINSNLCETIPAVMHEDGTARLQTVHKNLNQKFYNLINAFYIETGIPILLNTSFNGSKQPIVETPEEAISSAFNLGLDFLVIENNLFKVRGL